MKLNDYDFNILNENSFNEIDDESLKLKMLISEKEHALKNLEIKIKGVEIIGKLHDVLELKIKAKNLEKEMELLKKQYSDRKLSSKISDTITSTSIKTRPKLPLIIRLQKFVTRKILAKISKKFKSVKDIGDTLDALTGINENINELIAMKIPYGETAMNYEKLTAYLCKANKIHSQISKRINKTA